MKKEKMTLFVSYFIHRDQHRRKEIDLCMKNNIRNKEIIKIVNLGTKFDDPKVININHHLYSKNARRPTFGEFLEEMRKIDSEYYILANADIFFCSKISMIKDLDMTNRVMCLTRWNITANGEVVHYGYESSQDVWIFKGKPPEIKNLDFEMGMPACDGRFAYELKGAGLEPINPSISIMSYHVHRSEKRDYCPVKDRVAGEIYSVPIEDFSNYKK
jgi:hypothetical protein